MVGSRSAATGGEEGGLPGSGSCRGSAVGRTGDGTKAAVSILLAAALGGRGGGRDDASLELPGVAGVLPSHRFLLYFALGIALHLWVAK